MDFDELDQQMRVFETAHDHCVLPGMTIVARLDGRGFTRLTKEVHHFDAPFDIRFRDHMVATVEHLMGIGMRIIYGYTQSDEISLLFHVDETSFNRKERKLISILAGEASAIFSLRLGALGIFDCRICQLPDRRRVIDYFRWRQEDANRNALNAHCYWSQRREGADPKAAAARLSGMAIADKNEFLHQRGINVNDLPNWQKRGIGVRWVQVIKEGLNPITGQSVQAQRRRLGVDLELPMRDDYAAYIQAILDGDPGPSAFDQQPA
ncbi:MAG: guanylyltransferase [Planctomycetes bacterium]|nr:guanylyltransferase [Planctomycetota bacterium]